MNSSRTDQQLFHRLSYLLRHAPHRAGLTLETGGWVLLAPLLVHLGINRQQVERVVAQSDKQRFVLSGEHIRAHQGHSVKVDLELQPAEPPSVLYHGTVAAVLSRIRLNGLRPMQRHHVHLSPDTETARRVGARRGPAVILAVRSDLMYAEGHLFYRSENGVWLVHEVPSEFLVFP